MGTRIVCINEGVATKQERAVFLAAIPNQFDVAPYLTMTQGPGEPPPAGHFYNSQNRIISFIVSNGNRAIYLAVTDVTPEEASNIVAAVGTAEAWNRYDFQVAVERVLGVSIPWTPDDIL